MATKGIYLEKEVHAKLEAIEKETGVSISKQINNLVRERLMDDTPPARTKTPQKQKEPLRTAQNGSKDWSNIVQGYWKDKKGK